MIKKVVRILMKPLDFYYSLSGLKNKGYLKHPVWIDNPKKVEIGRGSTIGPFVYITLQSQVDGYLKIGEFSEISSNCSILCGGGIEIGDHVHIGPGVSIVSATNYYLPNWEIWKNPLKKGRIVIGDNVHIGTNAVILPGVTIGEGSVVGAGAVVTKDVDKGVIVAGVPAKVLKVRKNEIKD